MALARLKLLVTWLHSCTGLQPDTDSRPTGTDWKAVQEPNLAGLPDEEVRPEHSCECAGVVNIDSVHVIRLPAKQSTTQA